MPSLIRSANQIFTALSNNAVEVYDIPTPVKSEDAPEATRSYSLDLHGHRTDIRTVALSADEQLLASASNGELRYNVAPRALNEQPKGF